MRPSPTFLNRHLLLGGLCVLLGCPQILAQDQHTSNTAAVIDLALQAPLTTVLRLPKGQQGPFLLAEIQVPGNAPADLGVGAFRTDREGTWFQSLHPQRLQPGTHRIQFDLRGERPLISEPHRLRWSAATAASSYRTGIFFWSSTRSRCILKVAARLLAQPEQAVPGNQPSTQAQPTYRLRDMDMAQLNKHGLVSLQTGQRWHLSFRPDPMPVNPFDHEQFMVALHITNERGRRETVQAYYRQPFDFIDRGSFEEAIPAGNDRFEIRWRPRVAGRYTAKLLIKVDGTVVSEHNLPTITVDGKPWDDYVSVDGSDARFFVTGRRTGQASMYWPIGLNIRSVNDPRGAKTTGSRYTPDRGFHAYEAYLRRLAAGGANAVEIWMSSWNLALEWREDWHHFRGCGRYNQANAERLDKILDLASELGIRINLVIRNHGQGSTRTDKEWHNNPWNAMLQKSSADKRGDASPGPIYRASDFFTAPTALAGQERLRRYIIARYADHPAILGWKLWTEQNLTDGRSHDRLSWHKQAGDRWKELDIYDHPVTSHWSGNYRVPERSIVALPQLDYVCIDAYRNTSPSDNSTLVDLLWAGTQHPNHGLTAFHKPVIITEYGGSAHACPEPQLDAELRFANWVAMVSGYAGAPMLWWFEWVDQDNRWAPYQAIRNFLADEDLRNRSAAASAVSKATILHAASDLGRLWCGAWYRKGHLLGYVIDRRWAWQGLEKKEHKSATITIGDKVSAGDMLVEWWDADQGRIIGIDRIQHAGGRLQLQIPAFTCHLAFKLKRQIDTGTTIPDDAL